MIHRHKVYKPFRILRSFGFSLHTLLLVMLPLAGITIVSAHATAQEKQIGEPIKVLYWTARERTNFLNRDRLIKRAPVLTGEVETIHGSPHGLFGGLAVDTESDSLFGFDASSVFRANLDGSQPTDITTTNSQGLYGDLEFDVSTGMVYWLELNDRLWRIDVNSNQRELLYDAPKDVLIPGFAVDLSSSTVYMADVNPNGGRAILALDLATKQSDVLVEEVSIDGQIDLDVRDGYLYWLDGSTDKLYRTLSDGTGEVEPVMSAENDVEFGFFFDPHGQKAYFKDIDTIWSVSADGTDLTRVATESAFIDHMTLAILDPCDVSLDGRCDIIDVDLLSSNIRQRSENKLLDLNRDLRVDFADLRFWVEDLFGSHMGDANLDRIFNSTDLVMIFERGEYEDDIDGNSSWSSGDWNADGEFDSGDLVLAFESGGYTPGSRSIGAVPEPNTATVAMICLVSALALFRRGSNFR